LRGTLRAGARIIATFARLSFRSKQQLHRLRVERGLSSAKQAERDQRAR